MLFRGSYFGIGGGGGGVGEEFCLKRERLLVQIVAGGQAKRDRDVEFRRKLAFLEVEGAGLLQWCRWFG